MIVSASYRTDIPAFHSDRFLAQLRAGYALVRNPYSRRDYRVSLSRDDVDGFIFWTRNARPFREGLTTARGTAPFFVQYTVTGYPEALEKGTPPVSHAVEEIRRIVGEFGAGSVVWRYDPVIWTSLTGPEFHLRNFAALADRLAGLVDEVTLSAAALYAKTTRNLRRHAPGIDLHDPEDNAKRELLGSLGRIALERGMKATVCSQPHLVTGPLQPAKCVDAERLQRISGNEFRYRTKGNREGCFCAESRDIGAYDTCAHGCLYCYAVSDHEKAKRSLSLA